MKRLPTTIRRDGFTFRQIVRNDHAAVYSQEKDGEVCAYEVIRIGRHDAFEMHGKRIEAGESYPSSERWGSRAWTDGDLAAAMRRHASLTASPESGEGGALRGDLAPAVGECAEAVLAADGGEMGGER